MMGLDMPLWLAAALAAVALLLAVGVVHALAMRASNDRDVHSLRVRAATLRIEQLKRIAQRMRENAGEIEADADPVQTPPDQAQLPQQPTAKQAA